MPERDTAALFRAAMAEEEAASPVRRIRVAVVSINAAPLLPSVGAELRQSEDEIALALSDAERGQRAFFYLLYAIAMVGFTGWVWNWWTGK